MKLTFPAVTPAVTIVVSGAVLGVALGVLAGLTACSGARGSGHGRESTAAALAPNSGRGGVTSPWLDDPESHQGPASNEAAPVTEEAQSSEEDDDLGDGGGDDSGSEGGGDSGEAESEPEIEIEEGWGGDEDWEEDPGDE
jgi:hypothetical protein